MDVLVNDYVSTGDMEQVLVVTALNRNGCEINNRMREELKDQGKLGEERTFLVREPKSLNPIERRIAQHYQRGDVVTLNKWGRASGLAPKAL
jgi:hypothetical protein